MQKGTKYMAYSEGGNPSRLMLVKKHDVRDLFIIFAAIYLALANDVSGDSWHWPVYFLISAALLYILRNFQNHGALGVVLLTGGLVLYTLPYLGLYLRDDSQSIIYYSLYLLVVFILLKFNPSPFCHSSSPGGKNWLYHMITALIIAFVGLYIWPPIYQGFYALALLFLDRSCRSTTLTNRHLIFQTSLFYLLLAWYFIFVWGGFGRLHFLVYLMLPVLVLFYNRRLYFKAWYLVAAAPLGVTYGIAMRSDSAFALRTENFSGGSVGHHLVLMDEIRHSVDSRVWRFSELYDQFILLFLNWFPRDTWAEKPIGIGYWFVDEYWGRRGLSEGHSVSLGLWGEHIYLLPQIWVIPGFFAVVILGYLFKILDKISLRSNVVVLIFQVQLLTFFWGGMASFGSRVWWMVLPILLYVWFERMLKHDQT